MQFTSIELKQVRVIESASLRTRPGINLLFGDNGSGKTSVLEAIHLLSRGKSFRTPRIQELVQRNKPSLYVSAKADISEHQPAVIGLIRENRQTRIKFQGQMVQSVSRLAVNVPLLVQTTDSHVLLTGVPKGRRRWLDWLLFHVEPDYLTTWNKYHLALRNRNSVLRHGNKTGELSVWEEQMDRYGQVILRYCTKTIESMNDYFSPLLTKLTGATGSLVYRPGWDSETDFKQQLFRSRSVDQERGYTGLGPQRADIDFLCDGLQASRLLSRGQSKLYLIALLLAEQRLISAESKSSPVLLIDDVAAELDKDSRQKVVEELLQSGVQSFISTTDPTDFESSAATMFHVKRGRLKDVKLDEIIQD